MANFTLQQLEVFFAIVEYHSLSNAAKVLFISQPSLSKTLSRLEDNLGVVLFDRSAGSLTLTDAGSFLYTRLKAGYQSMLQAVEEARDSQSLRSRTLRVGLHSSFEQAEEFRDVWDALDSYEAANPDVAVSGELLESSELRTALLAGELDAIFSYSTALRDMPDTETKNLRKLPFFIAMSARNPLAASDTLDTDRLDDLPFFFVSGPETRKDPDFCTERLRCAGIRSRNISFMKNSRSIARAVVRDKGLMLTCHRHGFSPAELKLFPAADGPEPVYLSCAWRTGERKRELRDFLKQLSG